MLEVYCLLLKFVMEVGDPTSNACVRHLLSYPSYDGVLIYS